MDDVGKAEQGQGATETRRSTPNGSQGQRVTQTRSWGQRCAMVARSGVALLVGPPLPCDDPTEVRYAVHRGGRCVMAGTAPTVEEAVRLAFGSLVAR